LPGLAPPVADRHGRAAEVGVLFLCITMPSLCTSPVAADSSSPIPSPQDSLRKYGTYVVVEAPGDSPKAATSPKTAEDDDVEAVRKIFREWDKDGNGSISKEEMRDVMRGILGDMSDADLDRLMDEADKDGNGLIDLDEFVEWMMKPASKSQGKAIFSYAEECHCILQGALRLNPKTASGDGGDPLDLKKSEEEAFKEADKTHTGYITFPEFIQWMQEHIPEDISNQDLRTCCGKLATTLGSVFKVVRLVETGQLGEEDSEVLEKLLENLASSARSFEDTMMRASKTAHGWTEPPTGLSVERLKTAHMKYVPLHLGRVREVKFEVLCVPMGDEFADPESRIWLGEVLRKVVYKSGKITVEAPSYYAYKRDDFSWKPMIASRSSAMAPGGTLFEEALQALTPEIRLFCLLKTEANFGYELNWEMILRSLESAADMELITRGQTQDYIHWMEKKARSLLQARKPKIEERHVQDFLRAKIKLRPRAVMGHLTSLGFVQRCPVWEAFVKNSRS